MPVKTKHSRARCLRIAFAGSASLLAAGCGASLPGLSTASVKPAAPTNDTAARALQVGTTAARAVKCGYNFDAVKLRTQFLAAESAQNPADAQKAAQIYDTAFSGISKAVATQGEDYCSAAKTRSIKEALNRHLAGDYTPTAPEPVAQEEGLLSGFGSSSGGSSPGFSATLPTANTE